MCVTFNNPKMKLLRQIFYLSIILLFSSCKWFQPTIYFFISNTSKDKKAVDIKVSIAGKSVLSDTIRYTEIRPDLSNTPYFSLPKGKFVIHVSADNGQAIAEQSIDLENDRWVFVLYSYTPLIDTSEANVLLKNFGNDTSCVNSQLQGFRPSVKIQILDKEPIHI